MKAKFEKLWEDLSNLGIRCKQNKDELCEVFQMIHGCQSYLEIGAFEGGSLYVLGSAVKELTYIDIEKYEEQYIQNYSVKLQKSTQGLTDKDIPVTKITGNSTHYDTYSNVRGKVFDVVLIDGGHDFNTVFTDIIYYGALAKKYIFIHDIHMTDIARALDLFRTAGVFGEYSQISFEDNRCGYAVIKIPEKNHE